MSLYCSVGVDFKSASTPEAFREEIRGVLRAQHGRGLPVD